MRERRNWERVAVTVSSQPLTKTVSVCLGFHRCADWLKTGCRNAADETGGTLFAE